MDKNPFDPFGGYALISYLQVLAIACAGGLVKHLNSRKRVKWGKLVKDVITSGFTGVLTFWACESTNVHGTTAAILIAIGGLMGNRAWREFENIWRARLGLPQLPVTYNESEDKDVT